MFIGNSVDDFHDVHADIFTKKSMELKKINEPFPHYNYFIRPNENVIAAYLQYHPHQPQTNIPFSAAKAYTRKDGGNRMWLTFRSENPAIFCSLCILYGKYTDNKFIHGITDWKHLYNRIEEHESSKCHRNSVDAHILRKKCGSVDYLLIYGQRDLRKSQIMNN